MHGAECRQVDDRAIIRSQSVVRTDFRLQESAFVPNEFIFRIDEIVGSSQSYSSALAESGWLFTDSFQHHVGFCIRRNFSVACQQVPADRAAAASPAKGKPCDAAVLH